MAIRVGIDKLRSSSVRLGLTQAQARIVLLLFLVVDAEGATWDIVKQQRGEARQCRHNDDVHGNAVGRTGSLQQTLADGRCESTTNDRADAIRNRHAREANVGWE